MVKTFNQLVKQPTLIWSCHQTEAINPPVSLQIDLSIAINRPVA